MCLEQGQLVSRQWTPTQPLAASSASKNARTSVPPPARPQVCLPKVNTSLARSNALCVGTASPSETNPQAGSHCVTGRNIVCSGKSSSDLHNVYLVHDLLSASATTGSTQPVVYTPDSSPQDFNESPATKRRRAKRTEEERIDYLRSDPYVSRFEAYRVLCASCDKWIRLRPNSTYCSIPWDAHRKSCLAKKMSALATHLSLLPY
jgi:hypothetical protein